MTSGATFNTDRSFFTVYQNHKDGAFVEETSVANMTFAAVVDAVRNGEVSDVLCITECNPAEGWCNIVTAEVMEAAEAKREQEEGSAGWSGFIDPYRDERIGAFEAGVGRFGSFGRSVA